MIVSINQPAYLPWLGYYQRIASSDLHVILDNVQFEKNSYTNRNRIRTDVGWAWLTVPILTKGRFGDLEIRNLQINTQTPWRKKHWKTMCQYYTDAPFFDKYQEFFRDLFDREWTRLDPLCEEVDRFMLNAFDISTTLVRGSSLEASGSKSDLVLNICRELGASTYVSGALGRDYLDERSFADAGIELRYQDYHHPVYRQVYDGFVSHLSSIDLLFNCGDASAGVLTDGGAGEVTV